MRLYDVQQLRGVEAAYKGTHPAGTLMRAAGKAAAELAAQLLENRGDTVLVLAGPGDNGGDACETAALLAAAGRQVTLLLCANPERYSADARASLRRAQASVIAMAELHGWSELKSRPWALLIDGLFGIGLTRPLGGELAKLVRELNQLSSQKNIPVLALDAPSGLDADSGQALGKPGLAVRASHTLSFIGNKPGLHTGAGKDWAGLVAVTDLAIPEQLLPPAQAELIDPPQFAAALPPRTHDSHKGSYGDVIVLGGAPGMAGAAILAGRSALHAGAGRVYLGFIAEPPAYDSRHPELMCRAALDLEFSRAVLVIGPGMGSSAIARQLLAQALATAPGMVIDADALTLIAGDSHLQHLLAQRAAPTLLTPHPLEAGRLLGKDVQEIQGDRLGSARKLAKKFHAIVVLKGSGSVICRPDGHISINPSGNPGLASAGTGDVLAGLCGALLAQKIAPWTTAQMAAWVHGHAADSLVQRQGGTVGLTASELPAAIRTCLNRLAAA
ncbi:MAG: NAD(P)H-hydrate dehydratase [Burkholderiales bacterium]|nr:NAD(P)H-hydrate dehydratase [Burkholderiales bacterium]